jgi:epoxyqueuosine reductase
MECLQAAAKRLGFSQIGVADVDLSHAEPGLLAWLSAGFHGNMAYMQAHGLKRARPAELVPGTVRVLTARMDYLPRAEADPEHPEGWAQAQARRLAEPGEAVVSIYARGRDYHKVLRQRLQALAQELAGWVGPLGYRVFTDSAPVMEVELATRSALGWRGKHTLALSPEAGSLFFLGEIFLDAPLPLTPTPLALQQGHCGQCNRCIEACPTQAIVAPYRLDARLCISYLTIEHDGPIPQALREPMGQRIYGCDDCQRVCPWNKFAQRSPLPDFDVREPWQHPTLLQLWGWSEADFLRYTEGSPIRRIGYGRWRRNLAVAMGNALRSCTAQPGLALALQTALAQALPAANSLLAEHVEWALNQSRVGEKSLDAAAPSSGLGG